ncbi:hypothetical protein OH76DRAFT_1047223 [Lentinus brumalis]|uniref:Transmembrane protein n=1 Tax=Lentinus brumalis TaxID=2498619 RepID=A0A371CWR8_9APHY|nr:hypothetical protein OH76DRAFT_1047223 [Polyporus brumalis]
MTSGHPGHQAARAKTRNLKRRLKTWMAMYRVFSLGRHALVARYSAVCALLVSGSGIVARRWLVLVSLFLPFCLSFPSFSSVLLFPFPLSLLRLCLVFISLLSFDVLLLSLLVLLALSSLSALSLSCPFSSFSSLSLSLLSLFSLWSLLVCLSALSSFPSRFSSVRVSSAFPSRFVYSILPSSSVSVPFRSSLSTLMHYLAQCSVPLGHG